MSWLGPLLDQIMHMNNRDEVELATKNYLQPIADHIGQNIKDPEKRKVVVNAWWRREINAAVEISAVRNTTKSSNLKLTQEKNNVS